MQGNDEYVNKEIKKEKILKLDENGKTIQQKLWGIMKVVP